MVRGLALLLIGALGSAPLLACSVQERERPPPDEIDKFGRFITRSGIAGEVVHLPANAAGVLYQWTSTPRAHGFSIVDVDTGRKLPVRVRRLQALDQLPDMSLVYPVFGAPEPLFRLEPASRFEPGKRYTFRNLANGATTEVAIDRAPIDLNRSAIRMVAKAPAWREMLLFAGDCDRETTRTLLQPVGYTVDAPLGAYRARIVSFPVAPFNSWREAPGLMLGSPGYLDWARLAPRAFGLPDGLHYIVARDVPLEARTLQLASAFAFLEVEDRWHGSIATPVVIGRTSAPVFDSLAALRQAMRGGGRADLLARLAAIPVRHADWPETSSFPDEPKARTHEQQIDAALKEWTRQRRRGALERSLRRLARHRDGALRAAALAAIARVQAQNATLP